MKVEIPMKMEQCCRITFGTLILLAMALPPSLNFELDILTTGHFYLQAGTYYAHHLPTLWMRFVPIMSVPITAVINILLVFFPNMLNRILSMSLLLALSLIAWYSIIFFPPLPNIAWIAEWLKPVSTTSGLLIEIVFFLLAINRLLRQDESVETADPRVKTE